MVSIIIPIYNSASYLCECLDSIINTKFQDFEAILIDDGSDDNSLKICKYYHKIDPRFKVFHQNNSGASAARNYGLSLAKGEYIAFVDSDDLLPKYFFEETIAYINKYDADIVMGGYEIIGGQKYIPKINKEILYLDEDIKKIKSFFLAYASNDTNYELASCPNILSPWGKVFKRTILKNVKFIEELILDEDTMFNLYAMNNAKRVLLVPKIYYLWRINPNSVSRSTRNYKNTFEIQMLSMDAYVDYVRQNGSIDFVESLYIRCLWSYSRCLKCCIDLSIKESIEFVSLLLQEPIYKVAFQNASLNKYCIPRTLKICCKLGKKKYVALTVFFVKILEYKNLHRSLSKINDISRK